MSILDLSGANQGTVSFITNFGHRLYSDDFLLQLDRCFSDGDFYENQADPLKVAKFLDSALTFPDQYFDGALLWDALEFLATPLLETVVGRLQNMLRPGSTSLALFHAEERADTIATYSYRIADPRTIALVSRGNRRPAEDHPLRDSGSSDRAVPAASPASHSRPEHCSNNGPGQFLQGPPHSFDQ